MTQRRGRIGAALILLLIVGAFVGFVRTAPGGDGLSVDQKRVNDSGDTGASESFESSSMRASGLSAGGSSSPAPTPAPAPAPVAAPQQQPRIVKNARIRLEIGDGGFRQAFDSASRVAGAHGGFVVSSESSTESDADSHGVLVLRVPAASFDAVRADLSALGQVESENLTGEDVGGQIVDLDARIRSLQAQEESLRALMTKAKTIGETVEVQGHLTQVRQQIEQLSGEKSRLEDAAALATIRVELFEPGAAAKQGKSEPGPLADAVSTAVDGAETVVAGTIIVLGWLIPLAALAALGWLAYRPFRRHPALATAEDNS